MCLIQKYLFSATVEVNVYVVALSIVANKVDVSRESEELYQISVESVLSSKAFIFPAPLFQLKIIDPFLSVVAAKLVGAGGIGKV